MHRCRSLIIAISVMFLLTGCGTISSENEKISAEMNNVVSTENLSLQGIDNKVLESDGIIEPMDSKELITKLAALYKGLSLEEVIKIFGKEPFMVKEASANVFKYYSGDITITLWGTELFQAAVEYEDYTVMVALDNEALLHSDFS